MSITTVDDAIERLIDQQLADGGIPTQPARSDTLETDAGWAFFNANGYLGTVTEQGEVIDEAPVRRDRIAGFPGVRIDRLNAHPGNT